MYQCQWSTQNFFFFGGGGLRYELYRGEGFNKFSWGQRAEKTWICERLPPSQRFHSICKWLKPLIRLLGCIFQRTGNSVQVFQNFRIFGGVETPQTPLGTPLITAMSIPLLLTVLSIIWEAALLCCRLAWINEIVLTIPSSTPPMYSPRCTGLLLSM
jgi:hypothetical protein